MRSPSGAVVRWVRFADSSDGYPSLDAVAAVVRDDRGKILVSWQYNVGSREVVAEFAGGGAEIGEDLRDAARREICEEVGLWANSLWPIGRHYLNDRRSSRMVHWYLATDLEARALPGDEAEVATAWVREVQLDEWIGAGHLVMNNTMLSGWALYKAHRDT